MSLKEIIKDLHSKYNTLFLTKIQTAKALDVSVSTLDNYRKQKLIIGKPRGRKIYFSIEEVAKTLRDGIDVSAS